MITSIVLFLLLSLATALSPEWKPTCGAAQQQNLLNLIATDIFVRHFNSGALNSTLTECSNFHRHICPKQGMSSTASFQGLFDEIVAIERPCTKYDVFTKIEKHFAFAAQSDKVDYSNEAALSKLLFRMPKDTLISVYEYATLHVKAPGNFYSNVWDLRLWSSTIDQETFPAKYDPSIFTNSAKRKAFTDSLAANLKNIIQPNGGAKKMLKSYLPFLKDVTDYNHLTNVMFREGLETGVSRDRHHDSVIKVTHEYSRVLQNAAWSTVDSNGKTRYDIFKDAVLEIYDNILHSDMNNFGIGNSAATASKDFYNFYAEERTQLASLVVLPTLRNLIAVNRAHARVISTINLDMLNRWKITKGSPDSKTISGFFVWIIIQNQVIFDMVGQNSPDGALFGVMGYLYGHEMFHGVEKDLFPVVMPTSPVATDSLACSKAFYTSVGQRFPGDGTISSFWFYEEQADVYGTQIAYGALKTAIGSRIDDLAYPALNITHRQMFFYANSIFGCNVHNQLIINNGTALFDNHYTVNGRLAQVTEFQSTFQCSATDNMVFPESQHCPVFFPTYMA